MTLLTCLGALAVLVSLRWGAVPRELFATGQAAVAVWVLAQGVLTLTYLQGRSGLRRWLRASSAVVLGLGTASVAWSAAAAIHGPDPEYGAVFLALGVVAQGGLALLETLDRVWRTV